MNLADILTNTPAPGRYVQSAGVVFVIRCIPDIFTGEMLNVGVCGIDNAGKRRVKVMTEPGRLACLYGANASNVLLLAQAAAEAAQTATPVPSVQIVFGTPTPYYNSSLAELVDSTFSDQVTAALPHRTPADALILDDEKAQRQVIDAIKLASALDMELLANTPQVLIQTDKGPRTLRVPLQPRNGVGTIRSAYYSAQSLKTHLMDSVLDMECAARYRQKTHMGLFILRPPKSSRDTERQIDAVIDGIAYRAPTAMVLEVGSDPQSLALEISRWAQQAA